MHFGPVEWMSRTPLVARNFSFAALSEYERRLFSWCDQFPLKWKELWSWSSPCPSSSSSPPPPPGGGGGVAAGPIPTRTPLTSMLSRMDTPNRSGYPGTGSWPSSATILMLWMVSLGSIGDRLDDPLIKCVHGSSIAVMIHDHGGFRALIQGSGALRKV